VRDMRMFDNFTFKVDNPVYMWMFMIIKLPSAFFSGVRLKHVSDDKCIVTVRQWWFSKNPFKSIYFACLAMAAEMSTGILAMGYCYKRKPEVSMLVTKIDGTFIKKAKGKISFICDDGKRIAATVDEAIRSGKSMSIHTHSYGVNKAGEQVASFNIIWSFKSKTT
jgi:hypothetical protein